MKETFSKEEIGSVVEFFNKHLSDFHERYEEKELERQGIMTVTGDLRRENFHFFEPEEQTSRTIAVDGSYQTIFDLGTLLVACERTAYVSYGNSPDAEEIFVSPMHVVPLSIGTFKEEYRDIFKEKIGVPEDVPDSMDSMIARLRAIEEWNTVKNALENMGEGDILLVDGALWAGIKGTEHLIARIADSAREKGVILAGISKRSMIRYKNLPFIPVLQVFAERDEETRERCWYYPVEWKGRVPEKQFGKTFIVKYSSVSNNVFRTDIAAPEGMTEEECIKRISSMARDPAYPGYPYPLARAHNEVAISRRMMEYLRGEIYDELKKSGAKDSLLWDFSFRDFHRVLDTNR